MANEVMGWIGQNFQRVRDFLSASITKKGLSFNDDVFEDTIVKCTTALSGECLTDDELMKYIWVSFKNNTLRELMYSRNNTIGTYPDILTEDPEDKCTFCLVSNMIKKEFGNEIYQLFTLHANGVTYGELERMSNRTDLKYTFRKVRSYVREKMKGELD